MNLSFICAVVCAFAPGQPPAVPPAPAAVPLTFSPAAVPEPALKYRLQPALLDREPGNAAVLWLRAGSVLTERRIHLSDKQHDWVAYDAPANAVPLAEVRAMLALAKPALDVADLAARRERCEWENAPLTLQNFNVLMPEAQRFREVSAFLGLRFRLELAERQFDKAAQTLQTGLALGRHVGEVGTSIHALVGMAVCAQMLRHAEEWARTPDAPNLYWALSALPQPLIGLRKPFENESSLVYQTFPTLRHLSRESKTPEEIQRLGEDVMRKLQEFQGNKVDAWSAKLALASVVAATYPAAKQYLLAHGHTAEQVGTMPALQAVLIYVLEEYDHWRDEMLKWVELPYHQAGPGLKRVRRQLEALGLSVRSLPLLQAVIPSERIAWARARVERKLAGLRCVEAVRLFAAAHDGKLPATLDEIKEAPIPADPVTGRAFVYTLQKDRALLAAPPPPGEAGVSQDNSWSYELSVKR